MTTEDDFQAALDADPADWQTRLVFADWLQDRDDPRAEGYRALGQHNRRPEPWTDGGKPGVRKGANEWTFWKYSGDYELLPTDWFDRIDKRNSVGGETYRQWATRRAAEDAAALAFAKLPAGRRAELLDPPVPA